MSPKSKTPVEMNVNLGYLPAMRLPPRDARPVYQSPWEADPDLTVVDSNHQPHAPTETRTKTAKAKAKAKASATTDVDHHDITNDCYVRPQNITPTDTTIPFVCKTHKVRWLTPRCDVFSAQGKHCVQPAVAEGTTCRLHVPPPPPQQRPEVPVVEHHDLALDCSVRRERLVGDTHITFSCSTHDVRWHTPRCNVLSDDGYRCQQQVVAGSLACKFHDHPRLICNDCGHNVHWKDDDPTSVQLHHEDHRFEANENGRLCADCNLPGRMARDGSIRHRFDHQPQAIEWPWDTDQDEVASPLPE